MRACSIHFAKDLLEGAARSLNTILVPKDKIYQPPIEYEQKVKKSDKIKHIAKELLHDLSEGDYLKNLIKTIPRDIDGLSLLLRSENRMARWESRGYSVPIIFRKLVSKHPDKACFVCDDLVWTYRDVENYSNKIANIFTEKYKLRKGDVVALFMENRPEYVCIWLGLAKIGVISALINTNLKSKSLIHSIEVAKSKVLIYGSELFDQIDEIRSSLNPGLLYFIQDSDGLNIQTKDIRLESLLNGNSRVNYVNYRQVEPSDILMYIYTSGTTGLPKPAIITHSRYFGGACTFYDAADLKDDDVVYVTLPIYHATGGIIGIGCSIINGSTVVLRRKFSATNFWKDCIKYDCTAMVYVGELCRYLVNQPRSALDAKHKVRIAIGNGLRKNIWEEFSARFNVTCIEFYASSEGNCTIINTRGKIGACGFVPLLNTALNTLPLNIIKIDEKMQPIRNSQGFCIRCKPNETGLAIGLIGKSVKKSFSGYANNKEASQSKIIKNVFMIGQNAFNSGDLMMFDEKGWVYFCDRLGDTFRWKGENVSTTEVENILSANLNSKEVVVYGVPIPGQEGKAGMATIACKDLDIKEFGRIVKKDLTTFSRPLFIRLTDDIDHTGSFKVQKNRLIDEAFNIDRVKDKLYYYDTKEQNYLPLTADIYKKIQSQLLKV